MTENFFSLFQLPISLPVDVSALSAQYQNLQKKFHPDNYATASDSEKATAMQKSATINAAYQTLKDPVKAAEYRVSLEGIDINSEQQTITDATFLMEQFELREQLDDIEMGNDSEALDAFYDDIIKRKKEIYKTLLNSINQLNWQDATQSLYKLRYFSRLIEQIELLQDKLF